MTDAERNGGAKRVLSYGDMMMGFIFSTALLEHGERRFGGGLGDANRLESSFERGIFLNMTLVLSKGGRANATNIAAREGGFQDIRRIKSAACIAGADDGVYFVEKENDIRMFTRFTDDFFEARFEFATETGAGDQGG